MNKEDELTAAFAGKIDPPVSEENPGQKPEAELPLTLDRSPAGSDVISPRTGLPKRKYTRRVGLKSGKSEQTARTPEQITVDKAILAQALSGAFQGLGVVFGAHWPLQTKEQPEVPVGPIDQAAMLAEVWDPVLERYAMADMDKFKDVMMWVGAVTVTVALVKPRIEITVKQQSGIIGWLKRKIAERRMKK